MNEPEPRGESASGIHRDIGENVVHPKVSSGEKPSEKSRRGPHLALDIRAPPK
jgi:hypothetical protein